MVRTLDTDRLWATVQSLGSIGETADGGVMRVTGSEADREARDTVVDWFRDAGLSVSVDPVGNIVARRSGRSDAPAVATGSHLDTVPNGGAFDGVVGVVAALEVVRAWNESGLDTDRPVEIVVFTEEEGTRFGVGLLGSLVASGQLGTDEALALTDGEGTTLDDALSGMGYRGSAPFSLAERAAFVEMHVEQGPILDAQGIPIGVVESVAGITQHSIAIQGEANHAGTTPMDARRDALMGAAEFGLAVENEMATHGEGAVGTVGRIEMSPNGTNVIPGRVELGVDLRDRDAERLAAAVSALRDRLQTIGERRQLTTTWETMLDIPPRAMDRDIVRTVETAASEQGLRYKNMPSGAGHDAMNAASVTPTGMLFVPSEKGRSHSPAEFTSQVDLFAGTQVLEAALRRLAGA